jgi:hypothetical protein
MPRGENAARRPEWFSLRTPESPCRDVRTLNRRMRNVATQVATFTLKSGLDFGQVTKYQIPDYGEIVVGAESSQMKLPWRKGARSAPLDAGADARREAVHDRFHLKEIPEPLILDALKEANDRVHNAGGDEVSGIKNPTLAIRLLTAQLLRARYPNAAPVGDDRIRKLMQQKW